VTYKSAGGVLSVAGTSGIALTVSGFVKTDTIDLANFALRPRSSASSRTRQRPPAF